MNTNKTLMGGIAGGIAFFLLGWLFYGVILMDYMTQHGYPGFMKPESELMSGMMWLVLSNLAWGFLIAIVWGWAKVDSVMTGLKNGAIMGFLIALSIDLGFYAMSNMYNSRMAYVVDVLVNAAMVSIVGAVVAWVMNRGK